MSQTPFDLPEETQTTGHVVGPGESTQPSTELPDDPAQPTPVSEEPAEPGAPTRLVITRGPEVGAVFPVTGRVTTIGRHRDCDIVLDQVTVSRYHAELHRDGDRYTIVDAGSLNGTYLNRQPVDRAELRHGDVLWVGTFHLRFHTEHQPPL